MTLPRNLALPSLSLALSLSLSLSLYLSLSIYLSLSPSLSLSLAHTEHGAHAPIAVATSPARCTCSAYACAPAPPAPCRIPALVTSLVTSLVASLVTSLVPSCHVPGNTCSQPLISLATSIVTSFNTSLVTSFDASPVISLVIFALAQPPWVACPYGLPMACEALHICSCLHLRGAAAAVAGLPALPAHVPGTCRPWPRRLANGTAACGRAAVAVAALPCGGHATRSCGHVEAVALPGRGVRLATLSQALLWPRSG